MYSTNKKIRRVDVLIISILCVCLLAMTAGIGPAFGQTGSPAADLTVRNVSAVGINDTTINVSWEPAAGADGYYIYAAKTRISKYYKVKTVPSAARTNAGIGGCVTGKTYYFRVQAYEGNRIGRKSRAVSAASTAQAAAVKKGASSVKLKAPVITVSKVGSAELWVKISPMAGAKGYRIYRSTKKKTGYAAVKTIKAASSGKTKYLDTGLKEGKTYYYKVRAYKTVSGKKTFGKYSEVGAAVVTAVGNADKYNINTQKLLKQNLKTGLNGRTAYFLGSSVTKGMKAEDQSFADYLQEIYGLNVTKRAVNGTTLVGPVYDGANGSNSYITRLTSPKDDGLASLEAPDYFICQLSTNDAAKGSELGEILDKVYDDRTRFDTATVAGAIEYITAFARDQWQCPVIFYVQTRFNQTSVKYSADTEKRYKKMIKLLYQIQKKWAGQAASGGDQLLILDFWGDEDSQYASDNDRLRCMYDAIHPTKYGYLTKYVEKCKDYMLRLIPSDGKGTSSGSDAGAEDPADDPAGTGQTEADPADASDAQPLQPQIQPDEDALTDGAAGVAAAGKPEGSNEN